MENKLSKTTIKTKTHIKTQKKTANNVQKYMLLSKLGLNNYIKKNIINFSKNNNN